MVRCVPVRGVLWCLPLVVGGAVGGCCSFNHDPVAVLEDYLHRIAESHVERVWVVGEARDHGQTLACAEPKLSHGLCWCDRCLDRVGGATS